MPGTAVVQWFAMSIALISIAGVSSAGAQSYPTKPIRLIIPFAPGGSNDIVGRIYAAQLTERLGKPVVVDNRGGAGGIIGMQAAATAAPDGYTLLVTSSTYPMNATIATLPYDPFVIPARLRATSASAATPHRRAKAAGIKPEQ